MDRNSQSHSHSPCSHSLGIIYGQLHRPSENINSNSEISKICHSPSLPENKRIVVSSLCGWATIAVGRTETIAGFVLGHFIAIAH